MKDNQVSPLNYHFHYYFDDCIQKFGIKVMEHHFTNRKIEGLTMIDEDGISISYESQNLQVKQNFTKCHELGHYILGHSGKQFTQLSSKKDTVEEAHIEIEDEYRAVEKDVLAKILNRLRECYFVASTEFPELLENSFRKELEKEDNIDTWLEYDFGQSVGYAWRTDKLTAKQVKLRAKTILLLEKR